MAGYTVVVTESAYAKVSHFPPDTQLGFIGWLKARFGENPYAGSTALVKPFQGYGVAFEEYYGVRITFWPDEANKVIYIMTISFSDR